MAQPGDSTSTPESRRVDPRNLGNRTLVAQMMEGLGHEDGIDRGVRQWNLFSDSREQLGVGAKRTEAPPHRILRLDRDDAIKSRDEDTGELAGASSQIEHAGAGGQPRNFDHARRPTGTASLVIFRPTIAARGQVPRHALLRHAQLVTATAHVVKEASSIADGLIDAMFMLDWFPRRGGV